MRQRFSIPGRLPGLNEHTAANRKNCYAGAKQKRTAQNKVCKAIRKAGLKPMKRQVDVVFHWIEPNMRRDKDNIRHGAKYILDALVECGILTNDDWKHIRDLSDHYWHNAKHPRILVELNEVEH